MDSHFNFIRLNILIYLLATGISSLYFSLILYWNAYLFWLRVLYIRRISTLNALLSTLLICILFCFLRLCLILLFETYSSVSLFYLILCLFLCVGRSAISPNLKRVDLYKMSHVGLKAQLPFLTRTRHSRAVPSVGCKAPCSAWSRLGDTPVGSAGHLPGAGAAWWQCWHQPRLPALCDRMGTVVWVEWQKNPLPGALCSHSQGWGQDVGSKEPQLFGRPWSIH